MAIHKAITANDYNYNGASIVMGGTATSPVTNVPGRTEILGPNRSGYGSRVPNSGHPGDADGRPQAALAGRNWATMTANQYVILGETDYLAGTANAGGNIPAADRGRHNIHRVERDRRLHVPDFSYVSGVALNAVEYLSDYYSISDATETTPCDSGEYPTRAVPGTINFISTGKTPSKKRYTAKYNG